MDTFDIQCNCGVIAEINVPSDLDVTNWHCPGCGQPIHLSNGSKIGRPASQHNTTESPAPQYGISEFRGGDYS